MFTDVNECSDGNHVCDVNSNCNNTDGSHICTCKEGYTGDGQSCQGEYELPTLIKTSSFAHKLSPMKISPYFRDLFLRTTLVFSLDYFLYVTYVIIMIIIIIIIIIMIIIIALLCDKLAKIFFG